MDVSSPTSSNQPTTPDTPAALTHDSACIRETTFAEAPEVSPLVKSPESVSPEVEIAPATQPPQPINSKIQPHHPLSDADDRYAAAEAKRHLQHQNLEGGLIAAAAAGRSIKSAKSMAEQRASGKMPQQLSALSSSATSSSSISRMADGIGGAGLGTAATGDLAARSEFETIEDIRESVRELSDDYNSKHPDAPLSGRIIHVSHYIPFVIRPFAEVEFDRQREEKIAATASVAALAAAVRAKKAAKAAALAEEQERQQQRELQREVQSKQASANFSRKNSFRNSGGSRRPSFAGMAFTGLFSGEDLEARLRENQERSKRRAGRRAWMMTEVVDDTSELSEEDRFTPIGSRRGSTWSMASRQSFSSHDYNPWGRRFSNSGLSDYDSPAQASPPPAPAVPQWVLSPRRGHTALNSGIRSLCATHSQTFIGWPGDIQFAAQAKGDDRTDPSQTTEVERKEIEEILAGLEDPRNWAAQEAPIAGADPDPESNQPPVSKLPTPQMNGADPLVAEGVKGRDRDDAPAVGMDEEEVRGIKYVPVWLESKVAHGHYEGYSKTTLWPLFHYLLWQDVHSERQKWEDYSWEAYYAANEAFAQRIASEYRPGDLVWIHDYHLLLVPAMLRKLVPDAHIGLFVHAPFPSSEVFRCLPKRKEILEGMLGADLACFQAFSYSRHFLSSCIRVCGFEAASNSVESYNGHITNISYNPIGIDSAKIARDSSAEGVLPKIQAIREMYKGKKILIGRDKLDVVRGVIQKLQAFHKFLAEYPEWRNKVVLIQVTAPALNDSPKLEREVSELVSHINGEFGSLSFTPVHHYHQIIERDEYFALLSVADLALITSVRDGMNTTSMEYIICQERFNKSPLILSEFTGTAGRMRSAIQVNPWNIYGVAKAINYGLTLSPAEKAARHDQLYHQVVMHTSHTWAASLAKQLLVRLLSEHSAHFTPPLDRVAMVERYHAARKRLLLLDYDGTLTPIVKNPEAAVPSKKLLEALEVLSKDEKNIIYIISGRDGQFLSKHLGHLTRIGFSAEHGGFVKEAGETEWHNLTEELDMTWMRDIRSVFEYFTERTSGSVIEQKKSSITWHYRNADPDYGSFQAKECQALLENLTTHNKLAVEVLVGKKNLEVRPLAVNKGEIVKRILYNNCDAEFVFCAGDDKTDEDMFKTLVQLSPSNKDGPSSSEPSDGAGKRLSQNGVAICKDLPKDVPLAMSPPTPLKANTPVGSPKTLKLTRQGIYTTTIGASGKKTLAEWHVDGVDKIIESLSEMAGLSDGQSVIPSDASAVKDGEMKN